jgi:hypothetical protein
MSATNLAMSVETIAVENLKVLVAATDMSLTPSERIVADRLHSEGAAVYRTGWPDFLVVRADGRIEFVEVKSGGDQLSAAQRAVLTLLSILAPCYVERDGRCILVEPEETVNAHLGSPKANAGRIGGASTSPAKTAAAKVNGARGGRPRKAVAP